MSEGAVADRRLHPASLAIRFIRKAPEFVIGLPALVGLSSDAGARLIVLLGLAGAAAAFGSALLSWLRFRYGVGESDVVIESGVFSRQRRIIPFNRIQDIDIEQGVLARIFGTVTVRIETGGAAKDEGKLDAVDRAEADRLRDIILKRRASAGDAPAAEGEPLLFAMALPRLLIAGLFGFSLLYLAVLGGVAEYVSPFFNWRGIDPRELLGPAEAAAGRVTIGGTLFLIALLLLLGTVTGVVRTVARDYGFRLWRTPAGLRRKRGLFTRSEVVIPLVRIQLALIRSGFVGRLFGWSSLEYQTLGADRGQSGHQAAAPFARLREIMPILAATGHFDLPADDEFLRVSRLSVARRSLHYLVPLLIATIAAGIIFPPALLLLPLLPLLVGIAVLQWKRYRYALADRALVVSQGLFERRLWIVPLEKAQAISVSRTPLQRSLGLATVVVDTAGASLLHYPAIGDLDSAGAEALSARLLALHKAARLARRASILQEGEG